MEPPSFSTTGPQILRAAPGSDASLVLPLPSGSPPFEFEWSRAGAKLDDRFTKSDDTGGVRLTISAARTGDSGVYTLQASNAAGKDTTRVRLEVSPDEMPTGEDPPTFLRRLQDLTVKVGTRTRFLVEIVSSTECRVTWYRNERRLLEAERIALVRDGNFWCADISAVSVDDAGRWTCTAENVGGRASCSAHLNVLVPKAYKRPEFVEELRALLTEQGTVSLECKVVGVPTPVLRWFKDSREIKAGDVFALTANAEDPTSLGTYTCEAINCMGRAYSSSKVHVVGRASREGSSRPSSGGITPEPPPIFTKELEDQFVRICEPLTLSCHVVVPPWPRSVVWYNKEGKIEPSEKYHVLEDGVGGYLLEIPTAEWPDEGEWKCVATSTGGRVGISTCYVSMDVPKNYRKPRFMENLQAVLTEEGLVSFECKVVGFPTPVLSWFKDGQELKPGDVYQLTGTNSLGSYCCIARNCMGQASSSAELTVEDIQNQLNEEEKLQLFSRNQAPKFLQGLKSVEAKIDEAFRFTIKVAIPPEPTVLWYRDDQPVDESSRCHHGNEERGVFFLDIQNLEFMDQAEWKCVAMNDFGHSVTSCFLKLIIPRHYKKPRFLENLQAILSDEGAVNLECKVIGVPQPVLKWYKDGEELKPGDIHRIISGQDGTCCLGTYTCEAQNCMGIAASSASLLGFEDSIKAKNKKIADEQALQRNLSLSTIHEERTSQMYDTPVGDMTLDEKGEISFSFDGKEVSVSLYETPDLTEEEALQIVEMYADQLSENVTEHNVVELPPLRFVKETSTSGNLLMEAIIIDVSPEYFTSPEDDLRTEADIEDISIADENGPPQLSLDVEVDGEDYLEKTIALLSDEKSDIPKKINRKKSDSQRSVDDYFSLSRDQSLSEEKKDDDTQILSESDLQSFASARSSGKPKSKSSKPSIEDGQESSDVTKTVLLKEDLQNLVIETDVSVTKHKKQRRSSRSSRRSSSGSEKSLNKMKEDVTEIKSEPETVLNKNDINKENIQTDMSNISSSLTEVINEIQILERDIILKSEFMSTAATASNSLEIITSLITPLSEIHSIADAIRETVSESYENVTPLLNNIPQSLENLQQSLTIISKCIDVESDNKTLVKKTCMSIIQKCGHQLYNIIKGINTTISNECLFVDKMHVSNVETITTDLESIINHSMDMVKSEENRISEIDTNAQVATLESKHLHDTQKAIHELRGSLRSLLFIVEGVDVSKATSFVDIKKSEIILNDMSTPIQDLQTALEQIEILSVTESKSDLQKYNTEIIETAMESVVKLRTSFERLSAESSNMENKDVLSEVLNAIKFNIKDISIYLDEFETKTGKFDILNSDNKLEALQKMAQILINLENNLPMLDTVCSIKDHMTEFHKNLTKLLENVIESNDANKYFTLLEICDAVNRMNTSIKNVDSNTLLSLTSINNTFKIIHTNVLNNVFQPELNSSLLSNIANTLVCIQETINKAEELSLNENLEDVRDLSMGKYEESKVDVVLENIEQTIIAISNVTSHETTKDMSLKRAMENICPILVDLKCCIASLNVTATEKTEKISDLESLSLSQSIANPLLELHQTISILNQVIYENADSQDLSQFLINYAKPLLDLQHTLEILQHDAISQCIENMPPIDFNSSIANVVENLKSCILMIQEQPILEAMDDMSTLEDISGIKTTADILPSDDFMIAIVKDMENVQFYEQMLPSASNQMLQTLNRHLIELQNLDLLNVDPVESHEYSSIKSIMIGLEDIRVKIESILNQITKESSQELVLIEIVPLLQDIQQQLSVIDINTISVYKHITELNLEKNNLIKENIQNFKTYLNNFLGILLPAIEITENVIDVPIKIYRLRQMCEKLNISFAELDENVFSNERVNTEIKKLETMVNIFSETISFENTSQIKCAIENLYEAVIFVKDEVIEFEKNKPELLSKADIFIQNIHDIEKNIVSLEQCNFVNLCNSNILKEEVDDIKKFEKVSEEFINKEDILKTTLTELIAPLESIYNQLLNEKILLGSKEVIQEKASKDYGTLDLKSAEVQLNNLSEKIQKLEEYLNLEKIIINSDDDTVIKLNDTIHHILNSIECVRSSESIKAFCQPVEVIKNILQRILSSEKVKEKHRSLKETTETLLQHMEQYIEIIEIVEEVSAVIKLEDLKESANIVRELQQSIVTTESVSDDCIKYTSDGKIKEEQAQIAQKLHKALVTLQTQALESSKELASTVNEDICLQIIEVVSDLQNDLIALADINVTLEENLTTLASKSNSGKQEENTQLVLEKEDQLIGIDQCHLDELEIKKEISIKKEQLLEFTGSNNEVEPSQLNEGENNILNEELNLSEGQKLKQSECEKKLTSPKSEKLATINDVLIENIKEYISDNTMEVITKLSPPLHSEHLKKTVEIAKQLWDNIVSESASSEPNETPSFSTEQIELVLSLNEAILIMYGTTIEESKELEPKVGKDELQAFKNVVISLRSTLKKIISDIKALPSFDEAKEFQQKESNIKDSIEHISPSIIETISVSGKIENADDLNSNIADNHLLVEIVENLETNHNIRKIESIPDKTINTTDLCVANKVNAICKLTKDENTKEFDIEVRKKKPLTEGTLLKHLSEYFCDETVNIITKLSTLFKSKDLHQSVKIAHQLYDILSSGDTEIQNFSKEQLKLALLLEEDVSSLYELTVLDSEALKVLVAQNELLTINNVIKELHNTLKTLIESTLNHINLEISDFDDFKVIITKEPFKYELIIRDNILNTTPKSTETDTESISCIKEFKLPESAEVDKNDDIVDYDALLLDIQDTQKKIDLKENLQSDDFKEDTNSIIKLENLLKEVNDMIDISCDDNLEAIQNTLDEVQTIIMKLKSDFNGTVGDTINETLEDLECNVRSVQLQMNERSPLELLKEACVNLQVLVAHISEINDVEKILRSSTDKIRNDILDVCSKDIIQTVELIEKVSISENTVQLVHIISNLNNIKDTIKSLRLNFLTDAETLIMRGVDIVQSLDQIEEKIFCLERELEFEKNIDPITRDNILSAIHCVYGSISNMRGTISSVQKKYMYENYGEPSRYFLVSIKNVMVLLKSDMKSTWKPFAKLLRNVLNHFEDIKFYISFDKTARLPSDAAFTKIILGELHSVLSRDVIQNLSNLDSEVSKYVYDSIKFINRKLNDIEQNTTLEVKDKIPIFKELSIKMFELTEMIKIYIQNEEKSDQNKTIENGSDLINSLEPTSVHTKSVHKEDTSEKKADKITQKVDDDKEGLNIELIETLLEIKRENDEHLNVATKPVREENVSSIDDEIENTNILKHQTENKDLQSDEKEISFTVIELEENNKVQTEEFVIEKEFYSQNDPNETKPNKQIITIDKINAKKGEKEETNIFTNNTEILIDNQNKATEQNQTININQDSDSKYPLELDEDKSFENTERIENKPHDVISNIIDNNENHDQITDFENKNDHQKSQNIHKQTEQIEESEIFLITSEAKEEEIEKLSETKKDELKNIDNVDQLNNDTKVAEDLQKETVLKVTNTIEELVNSSTKETGENIHVLTYESVIENNKKKHGEEITDKFEVGDFQHITEDKVTLVEVQSTEDKDTIEQEMLVSKEIKEKIIKDKIEISKDDEGNVEPGKSLDSQKEKTKTSVTKEIEIKEELINEQLEIANKQEEIFGQVKQSDERNQKTEIHNLNEQDIFMQTSCIELLTETQSQTDHMLIENNNLEKQISENANKNHDLIKSDTEQQKSFLRKEMENTETLKTIIYEDDSTKKQVLHKEIIEIDNKEYDQNKNSHDIEKRNEENINEKAVILQENVTENSPNGKDLVTEKQDELLFEKDHEAKNSNDYKIQYGAVDILKQNEQIQIENDQNVCITEDVKNTIVELDIPKQFNIDDHKIVVEDDKMIYCDQNTTEETNNNILLTYAEQDKDIESNKDDKKRENNLKSEGYYLEYNKEICQEITVSQIEDKINIETTGYVQNDEKNKNKKKEIEMEGETKKEKENLIPDGTNDSAVKCEIVTKHTEYSDIEEKMKKMKAKIKVETITNVNEMDQETSPLSYSLDTKEKAEIEIVTDSLNNMSGNVITIKQNIIQVAIDNKDIMEEYSQINLEVNNQDEKISENVNEVTDIHNVLDEVSNVIHPCEILSDISPEVKLEYDESHYKDKENVTEIKLNEEISALSRIIKQENNLIDDKHLKEYNNNINKNIEETSKEEEFLKKLNNERQLTQAVAEKEDVTLNIEQQKKEVCLSSKTEELVTKYLENEIGVFKDTGKVDDDYLKEVVVSKTYDSICKEEESNISREVRSVNNNMNKQRENIDEVINLEHIQKDKGTEILEQSEMTYDDDKIIGKHKHEKEESPKIKTNTYDNITMKKTNEVVLNQPQEEGKQKDEEIFKGQESFKSEQQVQAETLLKEKQELSTNDEGKTSEKKQHKEKRRSKKSRETSKQATADKEMEIKSQDTKKNDLHDRKKDVIDKNGSSSTQCQYDIQNNLSEKDVQQKKDEQEKVEQKLQIKTEAQKNEIKFQDTKKSSLDDRKKDVMDKYGSNSLQLQSDAQNNLSKKGKKQEEDEQENVEQKLQIKTEAQKNEIEIERQLKCHNVETARDTNETLKLSDQKDEKETLPRDESIEENAYNKKIKPCKEDTKELKIKGEKKSKEENKTRESLRTQDIQEQIEEQKYVENIELSQSESKEKQKKDENLQEIKDYEVLKQLNENVLSIKKDKGDDRRERGQRKINSVIGDYALTEDGSEFSRPPGYIAKPFCVEDAVTQVQINNKGQTIYKAQTLLHESQLRYSMPPQIDQDSDTIDGRSQIKERIKAASESRSTLSEKRASSARDIKRKPVFSTFLTDRTAVESSRVKLTCSILSPTDPRITWYKNGVKLENKHKFRNKFVDGLITLEILNAVPSDSGEYSCSVENENGSVTSCANLKVYPSFEASPIPPTFTRSIRDNYHLAENELVLECRIRGQPLPTITWLKDDKPIALSERYQAHYLADGVCRLTITSPTSEDSGKYTCKAENSIWSDKITHDVYFTDKKSRSSPNIATTERIHFSRLALESRRPHFTNVLSDHKVVTGGTIGLQVEIRGSPTRVEWLREGHSITELYRNAQTYVDHGIYTLALSDVTEKESGLYTCRAYSNQGNVDMNASITVIQPTQHEGKPASIVSRPEKDVIISVGEDLNISFRVHGEPKAKVFFMKGLRDITNSQRVCKMTSDDYVKFTLKRTVVSDAGTYCIFARNAYGCDRAFVTLVIRQRASSDNLISDWTYPMDDLAISSLDRNYKSVPDRIPSEPSAVDGGNNWISLAWPKPDSQARAPILAYKVESWLLGKEGGARWIELGITPRNSFDAFNLKQGEEYHFRVTPRNRYGWGESVQTSVPIGIGLAGDRPEFVEILPGQLKVLVGETANLCCSFKGKPIPEIVWMKNGHDIEEEVGRINTEINNFHTSLRIQEVKIDDEGRYSCEASNIHGRSSTYARMAVITDRQIWQADAKLKRERSAGVDGEYPPQFTMRLRDRRVQATYPVRLTCQVVGNPSPILKWFKNEEEVLLGGRYTASQDEYFYTLEIAPTTLEDGGVYEAMARNGWGAVSCRCNLVVDKGIRAYIAPEFCCGLEPLYRLSEGEELRISAIVEAYPSVGVTWYRDGVRLRPSRRAIMTLDRDGQIELALASVTGRDAGIYTCTASNEVGMASTSGKVEIVSEDHLIEKASAPPIVISPDVPYSKEPMFIRKPRSSEAREGDTVIIECEVIGDPKPDVYWLRDFLKPDYYRDSSHFKRIGAGPAYRFEIPHAKLDYTGAYSIVAKNIHGETKAIISLQILAKDLTCGDDVHNVRFGRVEVIPRFDKELTDLLCYDGDAVEFECSITGNPDPDIRWFHYNEIIPECPDFETSYDVGTARLKIKQVTAEDEGTYTCEASNSLGKTKSSACLVVYPPGEPNTLSTRLRRPPALLSAASTPRSTPRTTPARSLSRTPGPDPRRLCSPSREIAPKFYTYPFNRVAEEGDTVVFQCAVKGLPPPWATWDKDGIIITPSARISIREKDEMFRILEIEQVTIEDVGLYRISLENDYGRAEASARLEVITQKGKFYGSTRSYSVSPRKTLSYRRRTPSFSKQD